MCDSVSDMPGGGGCGGYGGGFGGYGMGNPGSYGGQQSVGAPGHGHKDGYHGTNPSGHDDADTFQRELNKTPEKKDANEAQVSDLDQVGGLVDTWSDAGWGAIFETFGCAPCHFVMKEPDDLSEDTTP